MDLPEYYLTRCEFELLDRHKASIAELIGDEPFYLVELGAGDGKKTRVLLKHFLDQGLNFHYVPIDICEAALASLCDGMDEYCPPLRVEGLVSEYFDGLKWLSGVNGHRTLVLFLGSNIGNFSAHDAGVFLRSLWNALNDGDCVLIGFDLKKDIEQVTRAYNDSQGVTAEFNLNLLRRINRELGGHFDLDQFMFYSTYNVRIEAVESFLISLTAQTVYIEALDERFSFDAWEAVHTEFSHKYLESDIEGMARDTGFEVVAHFFDSKRYFTDSLWRVRK